MNKKEAELTEEAIKAETKKKVKKDAAEVYTAAVDSDNVKHVDRKRDKKAKDKKNKKAKK